LDTASEAQPGGSSAQGGASLVLLCGILPTIAVALLSLGRPAAFTHFEYGVYDRLTRAISPHKPGGHVAIVVDGDQFLGLITRIDLLNYLRRKVH